MAATLLWVRKSLQEPSKGLPFGLWYRGELAGRADLLPRKVGQYVLGYRLGERYVGKGLMTAALVTPMQHGRQVLGATDFFAGVSHANIKSAAVLQRLGFRVEVKEDEYILFRLPVHGAAS